MYWRVYTKVAAHSPWKDTGVVESNREAALKVWTTVVHNLKHHAFKLEYFQPHDGRPPILNGYAAP
jgi:hypothetical protein